jgi:nucleotide-binding universal stress UspA family protein
MRVVVATDGSAQATVAIDLVAGLSWPEGTTLRVVEAIETDVLYFGGPAAAVPAFDPIVLEDDLRSSAAETLAQARSRLDRPGVTVETAILRGRPATQIVEEARAVVADLVVVGSRGHGSIERMLLGSVSAEVVDHAAVPVLVARAPQVSRIVLGWDGSPSAALAAATVRWPIFSGASVQVLSVALGGTPWWTGFPAPGSAELLPLYMDAEAASREEHERLARDLAAELRAAGRDAVADVRSGDAATEILAAAAAMSADLIVLGSHGRTGLARLLLGSVARNVLGHASASVLVVRGPARPT